jgi:hypothetical protein
MIQSKEKTENIIKRIKLKRQTKLICTLNEKWNSYENISKYNYIFIQIVKTWC